MSAEIWKPVVGWETWYEVSSRGRVRSAARQIRHRLPNGLWTTRTLRPQLLRLRPNRRGHLRCMLCVTAWEGRGRRRLHAYVHALVAAAHIGPRPADRLVCHRNDQKRDNHVKNLYYGTRAENAQDAIRHGCHGTERRRRCRS